jgi:hypothetical protein
MKNLIPEMIRIRQDPKHLESSVKKIIRKTTTKRVDEISEYDALKYIMLMVEIENQLLRNAVKQIYTCYKSCSDLSLKKIMKSVLEDMPCSLMEGIGVYDHLDWK